MSDAAKVNADPKTLQSLLDYAYAQRMAVVISFDGEVWNIDVRGRNFGKRPSDSFDEALDHVIDMQKADAEGKQVAAAYNTEAMAELLTVVPIDEDIDFWFSADFRRSGRAFTAFASDYRPNTPEEYLDGGKAIASVAETAIAEALGAVGWLKG